MFAFVLASALALTWRKKLATGTYVVVVSLTYAPVRFMMDFLRIRDVAGADPRYGGFTPAQWACLMLFVFGLATIVYMRRLRARGVDPADVFKVPAPAVPAAEAHAGVTSCASRSARTSAGQGVARKVVRSVEAQMSCTRAMAAASRTRVSLISKEQELRPILETPSSMRATSPNRRGAVKSTSTCTVGRPTRRSMMRDA